MTGKRRAVGIVLIVLDVAAWAVFAYFLIKIITSATSITSCTEANCAGQGAEEAANYVPWVIGSAFAGAILLTLVILWFRLQPGSRGPTSWEEVAQMSSDMAGGTPPGWSTGGTGVSPAAFALPGSGPTWAPAATGQQASIVATRTVNATPTGMEMDIDMDVAAPGQAPRRVSKRMTVPPGSLARLYPGAVVPVTVNPGNPNDVTPLLG